MHISLNVWWIHCINVSFCQPFDIIFIFYLTYCLFLDQLANFLLVGLIQRPSTTLTLFLDFCRPFLKAFIKHVLDLFSRLTPLQIPGKHSENWNVGWQLEIRTILNSESCNGANFLLLFRWNSILYICREIQKKKITLFQNFIFILNTLSASWAVENRMLFLDWPFQAWIFLK